MLSFQKLVTLQKNILPNLDLSNGSMKSGEGGIYDELSI
jgi:hypothetical protein